MCLAATPLFLFTDPYSLQGQLGLRLAFVLFQWPFDLFSVKLLTLKEACDVEFLA